MRPAVLVPACASVFLSSLLIVSGPVSAQHSAGGAPSVGTATFAGGGSASGGDSSAGAGDGGAGAAPAFSGQRLMGGHSLRVSANTTNGVFTNYSQLSRAPRFGRARNGQPIIGTAIPRSQAPPPSTAGGSFIEGTYNPWIYAYDGFADVPLFGVYDPFALDFGFPIAGGGPSYSTSSAGSASEKGVLHFNVKPHNAEVYVDGQRVGKADQFDGLLHKLRLEAGVHRVELRAPGYQPIVVNVRIEAGGSMTYRGMLEKDAK